MKSIFEEHIIHLHSLENRYGRLWTHICIEYLSIAQFR